jgi:sporulation protein YlmC with PRC-barrel domain
MIGKWQLTGLAVVLAISLAATVRAEDNAAPAAATGNNPAALGALDEATLARSARATKPIGSHVYSGGSDVGKIADILIDREHAAVTAAILSVGGFLGLGEKLVAIPINQITIDGEARFVIALSKQDLTKAPAFDFAKLK